jgi:hypothetical protein
MAGKWKQGFFIPKNPDKCLNRNKICYRSGWELVAMNYFDNTPSILQWASESIIIPYMCPFKKKICRYIPDFFIIYLDRDGIKHAEIIEIKPNNQTGRVKTRSKNNAYAAVKNTAKFQAAEAYCSKQGISFRIITENDMFSKGKQ